MTRRLVTLLGLSVLVLLVALAGTTSSFAAPPTVEEAKEFVDRAERQLLDLWIRWGRADWVNSNFITDDTEILSAQAYDAVIAATMDLAHQARRFDGLALPPDVARKMRLIALSLTMPAPSDPALREELTRVQVSLSSDYGKGKYCPEGPDKKCYDLGELEDIVAESRDPQKLLDAWKGWRTISPPMRERYQRFVELSNAGARELGFADTGALWRSKYDMTADQFAAEVERLWRDVRPLYESLHCYVRARLAQKYGADVVPAGQPIPAHLLGNMWAQEWDNIYDLVKPQADDPGYDLTALIEKKKIDAKEMTRYAERFFVSLGLAPLPETFWKRSLLEKPMDRDVICHASAWNIDFEDDIRIKMCIDPTAEDFVTIHHELGHNYYQRAYKVQPPLFRDSANDGFHEALGDTLALSITPKYLVQVGLLDKEPENAGDIGALLRQALSKVAFLPFGVMMDQWRWQVFSGQVKPEDYTKAWWDLIRKYQGVAPPVARAEKDFDPGAKYHIPANTPYTRYFLAQILQFQFHKSLTEAAGQTGPLHRRTINGSKVVGARLNAMMELGMSRPWPDALEALTGQRTADAAAINEYFKPLKEWLDKQNRGQQCGW